MCPEAVVIGYGVNVGSNNPNYNVETDGFVFNDTTYDFELVAPTATPTPTNQALKDQCKNGGWQTMTDPRTNSTFRNQGQCVSYYAH
jgi:hypothetical protein